MVFAIFHLRGKTGLRTQTAIVFSKGWVPTKIFNILVSVHIAVQFPCRKLLFAPAIVWQLKL